MSNTVFYESWTWDIEYPKPFTGVHGRSTTAYSGYTTTMSSPRATLHAPTMQAILQYIRLQLAEETSDASVKGALGTQNDKYLIGEYPSDGKTDCVVFMVETGDFVACTMPEATSTPQPYVAQPHGQNGAALLFSLMPSIVADDEFAEKFGVLIQELKELDWDKDSPTDAALDAMFVLCDNVYRRLETPNACGKTGISVAIPKSGNIPLLSAMPISKGIYSPDQTLLGKFTIIKSGLAGKKKRTAVRHSDFERKYQLSERCFSEAEQRLIPRLEPWYVIPPEIIQVCEYAKKTTDAAIPMRNFMFRGPSGTGKTEGARAIAAGLGLPYMHITCGADDEKFDFIGQILPQLHNSTDSAAATDELPSMQDCESDPIGAYFMLTGEYNDSITAEQAQEMLQIQLNERASTTGNDTSAPSYQYIKTQLITAIENGYLIELQEPSVILKEGVLVSLNSLFDTSSSSIQLPTGEVIYRHPDAVVVITTNTNYEGCRRMNQSLLSRMNLIIDLDRLEPKVMAERAMRITGCTEKTLVTKMAETIYEIDDTYRDTMDGVCGIRELISWVQSYMICSDALEAAKYTVLSSFSADREMRSEMESSYLNTIFVA